MFMLGVLVSLSLYLDAIVLGVIILIVIKIDILIMLNHFWWYLVLVGGIPTALKNMKVSWDDYSQYMEK